MYKQMLNDVTKVQEVLAIPKYLRYKLHLSV